MTQSALIIVPVDLKEANAFVKLHHRHNGTVRGHKFSFACADEDGRIRGVSIVGRPRSRLLQDGWTLEVNRVATDGCPNACSALYAASWRAAKAMGYTRLITYTLTTEPGTTLKAAGWKLIGESGGGTWNRKNRPRVDTETTDALKLRWEVDFYPRGENSERSKGRT